MTAFVAVSYTHLDVYKRQVNGTGPKGTVTHADTAVMATVNATNAIERVRDPAAVFF